MRKLLLGAVVAVAMAATCFAASPPVADLGYQAKVHQVDQEGFLARAVLREEGPATQHMQVAAEKRGSESNGTDGKRGSDRTGSQVAMAPPYRLLL